MAISFQAALMNGGPVSLSYGILLAAVGNFSIVLSLAEMASMYVGSKEAWPHRVL
jgi:choline transport protein